MKVLITGASGFVARHMVAELTKAGHKTVLTSATHSIIRVGARKIPAHRCDLTNYSAVEKMTARVKPDAVVHLSGISQPNTPGASASDFVIANVTSTFHLCAALTRLKRPCRFLYASSAFIYPTDGKGRRMITESNVPAPVSAYGLTKLAGESVASAFASKNFYVGIVRPFNHIGPGQDTRFVCPAFAQRIARARNGDVIKVGNLNSHRDFADVRDVVRAYRLIIEKKPKKNLFVIGSGRATKISDVLKKLVRISGKKLKVKTDPKLFVKHDSRYLVSNPKRAKSVLGWSCRIPLDRTLRDIYARFQ